MIHFKKTLTMYVMWCDAMCGLTALACQNKQHARRNTEFRMFRRKHEFFKAPVLVLWMCSTFRLFTQPTFLGFHEKRVYIYIYIYIYIWYNSPRWARASSFTRFLDHTQRRTTVGRTVLDEWSARRGDLYLTTHDTHNRHPCPRWDSKPQFQ